MAQVCTACYTSHETFLCLKPRMHARHKGPKSFPMSTSRLIVKGQILPKATRRRFPPVSARAGHRTQKHAGCVSLSLGLESLFFFLLDLRCYCILSGSLWLPENWWPENE